MSVERLREIFAMLRNEVAKTEGKMDIAIWARQNAIKRYEIIVAESAFVASGLLVEADGRYRIMSQQATDIKETVAYTRHIDK